MRMASYLLLMAVIGVASIMVQPLQAKEQHQASHLVGSWQKSVSLAELDGTPCPYLPDTMEIFPDQTMIVSLYGDRRLPFKTVLTKVERQMIEERLPDLKGKNLMLVLPAPSFNWVY